FCSHSVLLGVVSFCSRTGRLEIDRPGELACGGGGATSPTVSCLRGKGPTGFERARDSGHVRRGIRCRGDDVQTLMANLTMVLFRSHGSDGGDAVAAILDEVVRNDA